jgi:predicted Rossmann fold nucleotide-binding protein DprA/Smf involved in DNA uptake
VVLSKSGSQMGDIVTNREIRNRKVLEGNKSERFYWIPKTREINPQVIVEHLRSDKPVSLRFISNVLQIPIPEIVANLQQAKQLGLVEHTDAGWRAIRQ